MWKLLVDLSPEIIIDAIDWRYLEDALSPQEALKILNDKYSLHTDLEHALQKKGPKAYSTAGG